MNRARRLLLRAVLGVAAAGFGTVGRAADTIAFADLYEGAGILGLKFSAKLQRLVGREAEMTGFMAPPLKAESTFFVLTRTPLALCPFCQTDADWPADIVVVLLAEMQPVLPYSQAIGVVGKVEIGPHRDPETGFVSQVRLVDARYRRP